MSFCLPPELANKLLTGIKNGEVTPEKLTSMSSDERRSFLEKYVGPDDAKEVNTQLESKLILKDQNKGLANWAKNVTGIDAKTRADLIDRINKIDKILQPADKEKFLSDLAEKKLKTAVTPEEAKNISTMAKAAQDARGKIQADSPAGSEDRLDYGSKAVTLQNYISELKNTNKVSLGEEFKRAPVSTIVRQASKSFSFAKAIKNVGDLSSLFHQGYKALTTHPGVWAENAISAIRDAVFSLGKKGTNNDIMNGIKADIYSRPNAIDGTYQKMGLAVGNIEEQLPSMLPEKIPLFGRIYKATETGFNGFLYRTRADLADLYVKIATDNGVDIKDPKQAQSIGNMVNALTGRGKTSGVTADTNLVNAAIYSQKLLKSNFDFLTAHTFQKDVTPFVRKTAALNLLKTVAATSAVLATAKALQPNSVTFDPRSTNFGKVKVGGVSFDVTGGMASIAVLAARLIENSTVSSTGKVTQLNTGKFGSQTSTDVLMNYLTGKLSPVASVLLDLMNRSAFGGAKITVGGEIENGITPFPIQNYLEGLKTLSPADSLLAEIADSFGILESLPYQKPTK